MRVVNIVYVEIGLLFFYRHFGSGRIKILVIYKDLQFKSPRTVTDYQEL